MILGVLLPSVTGENVVRLAASDSSRHNNKKAELSQR